MAGSAKVNQQLSKVARTLNELRETLFECSRESVKGESGGWNEAEALFSLAKSVDSVRRQALTLLNGSAATESPLQSVTPPRERAVTKPSKKKKEDYPRYEVRGRSLIKTGLGRDERTEYEHVVPRVEFEKVVGRIASLASTKKEFTADDVQESSDCPMYQTYMVLSLLRHLNLLDTPRRGTYQAPAMGFTSGPDAIWDKVKS